MSWKDLTVFYRAGTFEPDVLVYEEEGCFVLDVVGDYDLKTEVIEFDYEDVKKLQLACRRFLERNKEK